ncbi:hypothetical protein, partial [Fluviicola sp.]|uniref:hypothetical protein n=1 Tax=Fluviicola sp. TaxID=1917219 RepID=UPI00260A7C65
MKKIKLAILLFLSSVSIHAQNFDYSSSVGWTTTVNTFSTLPSCGVAPASLASGFVSIHSGRVNFNQIGGAHENRISIPLGNIYDEQFNMDFDFNVSANPPSKGIGAFLAALGSRDLTPGLAVPMTVCNGLSIMDAIGILCTSPLSTSSGSPNIRAMVYDDGVLIPNTGVFNIAYNTTYYTRLQVYGNGRGELTFFSNIDRTMRVGGFCFEVPKTIRGLTFLNHGTSAGGHSIRETSGWVDNTNIYRTGNACCQINIQGK